MESNQLNSPKVFSHKGQGKSTHFQAQMKRFQPQQPKLVNGFLKQALRAYLPLRCDGKKKNVFV